MFLADRKQGGKNSSNTPDAPPAAGEDDAPLVAGEEGPEVLDDGGVAGGETPHTVFVP